MRSEDCRCYPRIRIHTHGLCEYAPLHTSSRDSAILVGKCFWLHKLDISHLAVFTILSDKTTFIKSRTGIKVYDLDFEMTPTAAEAKNDGRQSLTRFHKVVVVFVVVVFVDIPPSAKRHGHVVSCELDEGDLTI